MPVFTPPTIDYLLLKVAARCNIDCSYCYWFEDESVYQKPKTMSAAVTDKLIERVAEQVRLYKLPKFSLLFHGGEPMLWGIENFKRFASQAQDQVDCEMVYSMTTNGTLVNEEWAQAIKDLNISVTVSLDGPQVLHDKRRKTFTGGGTFEKAVHGFELLREHGVRTSVLAVCDPTSDPEEICDFFAATLRTKSFDILIPEANHDKPLKDSIAPFYKKLFDLWLDRYLSEGVNIRIAKAFAIGVFGGDTHLESIGYGAQQTSTILTDGSMEPLDVLRYAGNSHTATKLNIFENSLQDIVDENLWRAVFNNSLNLPDSCRSCQYRDACGGGYAPHRYSAKNGYNNESVYCDDYQNIFRHVFTRINQVISVQVGERIYSPEEVAVMETG